jgi:hypothetical protein
LGFQTKGPVALLLPGLGILALLWQRRQQRWAITLTRLLLALVLFAVVGLGWFALVYLWSGAEPLAHFFLRENLERFAAATYDVGRRPWWYYLHAYLTFGLPWSPFLAATIWHSLRREPEDRHSRLLLGWMGLMAILLTLSRGKIDYYLLPLLPPVSLVIGRYFGAVPWGRLDRIWGRIVSLLVGVVVAVAPAALWRLPSDWLPPSTPALALILLLLSASLACLITALFPTPRSILAAVCVAAALLFFSVNAVFLPAFRAAQPHREVVEDVLRVRQHQPDVELIVCNDPARLQRDLLFHARVAALRRCDLETAASLPQPLLLLLQPEERAVLAALPTLRELVEYRYLPASALTLRGFLAGPRFSTVTLMANETIEARGIERADIHFVEAAGSTVERDDYLIPYDGGEPLLHNLALTHSLTAIAFPTLGFTSEAVCAGTSVYHVPFDTSRHSLSSQSKNTWEHRLGAYSSASAYRGRRRVGRG